MSAAWCSVTMMIWVARPSTLLATYNPMTHVGLKSAGDLLRRKCLASLSLRNGMLSAVCIRTYIACVLWSPRANVLLPAANVLLPGVSALSFSD